ncbi:recombinase family protein [Lysinibacillus sp. RSDA_15]|uniref:recombinase family protein n=1 Tax=Lysinibacillus TaxID=400634 RepID=UPI0018CC7E78|nr:recombinase family protein [Lysinibacillus sphaericus]MBG9754172.1 resolvase [Lysinibacillus sphaericus]QTB16046.1 recombinase family protein [Lysinibacillus sphaericus]
MKMNLGYVRVSSTEQNLDRQYEALRSFVNEEHIYSDKASGKDFEREGFKNLMKALRKGDTLYIKSIDRLGRNKEMIKKYLEQLKKKGVRLKVIDIPTTMQDRAEGEEWVIDMINNILVEVYTSIAEHERKSIRARQAEGIAVAKTKGKHLGRPVQELPKAWERYYKQYKAKEIKAGEFMKLVEMPKATFYKKLKEYEQNSQVTKFEA